MWGYLVLRENGSSTCHSGPIYSDGLPAGVLQTEVAQKERMESMWKAEQERRAKAGEDFQTDVKSRAATERVTDALEVPYEPICPASGLCIACQCALQDSV